MLHVEKSTDSIVKNTSLICGLLFAAVLVFPPVSAHAQCAAWEASGQMWLMQAGSAPMSLNLVQKGKLITGTAGNNSRYVRGMISRGKVDGTLDGDSFSVQIYWDDGHTGVYNGKVLLSGRLDGETYDKGNPNIRGPWHTDGVLKCAPPPAPKPIKSSGKMPAARPAAPPLAPPFITASPPIQIPFVPGASVYLGWDGGPDYPNANVWVSINNAPEISAALLYGTVLKQPKIAGFELKLQGGLYKYFLKAAGTTLATVTVAVP